MWNENIYFYATLARPKAGVRFDVGSKFTNDVEDAVNEANSEWKGDRIFEIIEYSGISVKMAYRALDLIRGKRTLTRYLQRISQILAYDKEWNKIVTRKEGMIFTVKVIDNPNYEGIIRDTERPDRLGDELTIKELLTQILEVITDIREEVRK